MTIHGQASAGGHRQTVDAGGEEPGRRAGGLGADPGGHGAGARRVGVGQDQRVHLVEPAQRLRVEGADPPDPGKSDPHCPTSTPTAVTATFPGAPIFVNT